jgi:DNA-binding transcriptional LysR family regulator
MISAESREAGLNWDDLKYALAVGRTGSLTQAALQLGVNQSTATRRLIALEAEVGEPLFVRTQSGLTPTDAGRLTIARAADVERRVDRLHEQIAESSTGPSGTVYLRGNGWALDRFIKNGMVDFLKEHPRIDLRMATQFATQTVQQGATVSLWFERNPREMEFPVKIGSVPYAVYRARDADPENSDWVGFRDEEVPRLTPSRTTDRLRGKNSRLRLTAPDAGLLRDAVAAGIGRGLLPQCLCEEDSRLVRVGSGEPDMRRELSLHLHPDTVQTKRVQAVIRWLRESFVRAFAPCDAA